MKYFTSELVSGLLLVLHVYGQSVSDLPQCGQNCFNVMFNEYSRSCSQTDAACLCSQPGFNPDMTSCISQQCTAAADSQTVNSFVDTYCGTSPSDPTATATTGSIGTIIVTSNFSISDTATSFPSEVTVLSTRVPIPFSNGSVYPTRSSIDESLTSVLTVTSGTESSAQITATTNQPGSTAGATSGPATPVSSLGTNAGSQSFRTGEQSGLIVLLTGLVALFA